MATQLKSGAMVNNQIKKGFLLSLSVNKSGKIGEYLAKLQAIVSCSLCACLPHC